MTCVADDITECVCPDCTGDRLQWEHWQGWHDDGYRDGCRECAFEYTQRPAPGEDKP